MDTKIPAYDPVEGANATPSTFYNIGDFELQDNIARVWWDHFLFLFPFDVILFCSMKLGPGRQGVAYQMSKFVPVLTSLV